MTIDPPAISGPESFPPAPTGPLEVRPNLWMVGHRNPNSLLQCNTYIRVFEAGSTKTPVCVDPGSQVDYPVIRQNIEKLLGSVSEVSAFSLNHQDPDVVGNAPWLCEANPNVGAMVTEDVWRLAQHLGIRPKRLHFANASHSQAIAIGERHRWQLVPTPFCHFRGAMAFFDPEIGTLFSGDLFGGLNRLGHVHLWADDFDWPGVAQFHQIYMPTREALRFAVRQIRALGSAVQVIAPQHGCIIQGDLVPVFLERVHELAVGFDLLALELDETYLRGYRDVIDQLIMRASEVMGRDEALSRLQMRNVGDGLEQYLHVQGDNVELLKEGYSAVVKVLNRLGHRELPEFVNSLRSAVLTLCSEQNLPIPPIGAGIESGTADSMGPDGIHTQAWWMK